MQLQNVHLTRGKRHVAYKNSLHKMCSSFYMNDTNRIWRNSNCKIKSQNVYCSFLKIKIELWKLYEAHEGRWIGDSWPCAIGKVKNDTLKFIHHILLNRYRGFVRQNDIYDFHCDLRRHTLNILLLMKLKWIVFCLLLISESCVTKCSLFYRKISFILFHCTFNECVKLCLICL